MSRFGVENRHPQSRKYNQLRALRGPISSPFIFLREQLECLDGSPLKDVFESLITSLHVICLLFQDGPHLFYDARGESANIRSPGVVTAKLTCDTLDTILLQEKGSNLTPGCEENWKSESACFET